MTFAIRALEQDNHIIRQRIARLQEQLRINEEAIAVLRGEPQTKVITQEPSKMMFRKQSIVGTLQQQYKRHVQACELQSFPPLTFVEWHVEREAKLREVLPHVTE